MTELEALLGRFRGQRILVAGDMVADEYLMGRPARISREAPVLILHYTGSFVRPGGATNTAYNLARLGARTAVAGVIGDDEMGRRLRATLAAEGIDVRGMVVDKGRPTSTKTRIVAKGTQEVQQQIVRLDRVDERAVDGNARDTLIDCLRRDLAECDAFLVSDYENGVISPELIDASLPLARQSGAHIVVDSHGDLLRFKEITAATPNQPEAAAILGRAIRTDDDLDQAGQMLLDGMAAAGVLITRGSEGIALYQREGAPYKLPIALRDEVQVVDPTGAGDTVSAVFTLALAAGATMRQAAYLGNIAGGEVVRKLGAATVSRDEIAGAASSTPLPWPPLDAR